MIFLRAQWENIVMANYALPASVLEPYLPTGCELDFYQNTTYVSLVGFMFKNTSLFQIPIPWLGTFEEINLRFYVIRKEGSKIKRGVVFINETIPYKLVAWVANKLYKEHYTTIPTKNSIIANTMFKEIEYQWRIKKEWNSLYIKASGTIESMSVGGFEEYIFEHYYGYTKINESQTEEYIISHPRWNVNKIIDYKINCDFDKMYGNDFSFLNTVEPSSVFIAEGSSVAVDWKRKRF